MTIECTKEPHADQKWPFSKTVVATLNIEAQQSSIPRMDRQSLIISSCKSNSTFSSFRHKIIGVQSPAHQVRQRNTLSPNLSGMLLQVTRQDPPAVCQCLNATLSCGTPAGMGDTAEG